MDTREDLERELGEWIIDQSTKGIVREYPNKEARNMDTTRAQIGFYANAILNERPVAVVTQQRNGHPTGSAGVVGYLIDAIGTPLPVPARYDAAKLAAHVLHRFASQDPMNGFAIDSELHDDTRFYYAVTPIGVTVFDARKLTPDLLNDLSGHAPMFFTSWSEDERRRKIEAQITDLEGKLKGLYLNRESVRRSSSIR